MVTHECNEVATKLFNGRFMCCEILFIDFVVNTCETTYMLVSIIYAVALFEELQCIDILFFSYRMQNHNVRR